MTDLPSPLARRMPLSLSFYRLITRVSSPLFQRALKKRVTQGKEDPHRLAEREGRTSLPRPKGKVIWVHTASVGESLAALPLIERLLETREECHVLVTTGTVTSAELMAKRLPSRALHQYVPIDRVETVRRFLDHWKPNLALWIESEFWPNLIIETARRQIPMGLINARMSESSYRRWKFFSRTSMYLLECYDQILTIDDATTKMFHDIGATHAQTTGNLKFASSPLPYDENELQSLKSKIGPRSIWLAASTHPGEEEGVAKAQTLLQDNITCLLCIVPRHPNRGPAIADMLQNQKFHTALRSQNEPVTPETNIYIADTLGELGLFYRLADAAFIGGSLIEHGGQNPLEPARLDCAFVHGPHVFNFSEIYETIDSANGSVCVHDANALATSIHTLLTDQKKAGEQAEKARTIAESADHVLTEVMYALEPILPEGNSNAHA